VQGVAERIKHTPMPRQYDFFTRVFVLLFGLLLPFGLLGTLAASPALAAYAWLAVPVSVVLSAVFVIMERTGAANEAPFENRVTDIPLDALCAALERELLETLGTPPDQLPPAPMPQNGYLM